ncbi:MAG: hypothetical protein A2X59_02805 [Nitrospirae bacterium GWC2_42_7]|nr:MAG: hypothetical protein A2X59_02805 [Nitrospirae bacterium GWC2_42_7]
MSRPKKCRCVRCKPNSTYFKPRGIPLCDLEELSVNMDEIEAVRLSDYKGLYHEDAAKRMKISRATFGRILNDAHKKIAECLLKGKALRIEKCPEKGAKKKTAISQTQSK